MGRLGDGEGGPAAGGGLSRRHILGAVGAGAGGVLLAGTAAACGSAKSSSSKSASYAPPNTPDDALNTLLAGNQRYLQEKEQFADYSPVGDRIASKQKPFAAILSCADSRVAPNLIFDVAHGNIFVCRLAGNIVDDVGLGSLEYGVGVLGVKLVMVLGHSDCGAVNAAIGVVEKGKSYPSSKYGAVNKVLQRITPTVKSLPAGQRTLARCTTENAIHEARRLAGLGPIIKPHVADGSLKVVAAKYDIGTGKVSVLG
jgi:carbonic anhydrase